MLGPVRLAVQWTGLGQGKAPRESDGEKAGQRLLCPLDFGDER